MLFISYIRVEQQGVVCTKSAIMLWPTIQLHGCQIHSYVVSITQVHSLALSHSVVTYLNILHLCHHSFKYYFCRF